MKVVVLGSGVIGLWTAFLLSRRGYQVDILSAAHPLSTTSAVAASVLTPFLPWEPAAPIFKKQVRWAAETLRFMKSLPIFEEAAQHITCYEFGRNNLLEDSFPVSRLDHLTFSHFNRIDLPNVVSDLDFAIQYECFLCYPWTFLPWLLSQIEAMGGSLRIHTITSARDLEAMPSDVVFNCMGFHNIFPDDESFPVFGQSMFIPDERDAPLYFGIGAHDHGIFRHRKGFYLGSFFIRDAAQTVPQQLIYQRSLDFVANEYPVLCESLGIPPPQIDLARIERVQSGIRPFRRSGPLIMRERVFGKTIIHNYGHGAHGWTIGYAAAQEAVSLLYGTQASGTEAGIPSVETGRGEVSKGGSPAVFSEQDLRFRSITSLPEIRACARLMTGTDPWKRLNFDEAQCESSLLRESVQLHGYLDADASVVAFMASIGEGISAEPLLEYLCVAAPYRSQGLGAKLIAFFEESLFADADNLYLFVSDINPSAAKLYRRLGYVPVGAMPDFNCIGQTEFLYRKTRRPRQSQQQI